MSAVKFIVETKITEKYENWRLKFRQKVYHLRILCKIFCQRQLFRAAITNFRATIAILPSRMKFIFQRDRQ